MFSRYWSTPITVKLWQVLRVLSCLLCLLSVPMHNLLAAESIEIGMVISYTEEGWIQRKDIQLPLALKAPLYKTDTVRTNASGKVQILFEDETTISIAPGTNIQLEDFVFEDTQSSFGMQITSGAARVVTGQIVKINPDAFTVNTPRASVGIRGTDCTVIADSTKTTVIANRITSNDIRITNHTTGQVTNLTTTGMAVDAMSSGNISRLATDAERTSATQSMRSLPPVRTSAIASAGQGIAIVPHVAAPALELASNNAAKEFVQGKMLDPHHISGHFSGDLSSADPDINGTYGFDVRLGTGRIRNATMELSHTTTALMSAEDGRGFITNNLGFEINHWDVEHDALNGATPSLNGQFNPDGTLPSVNWQIKDDNTGQNIIYNNQNLEGTGTVNNVHLR